MIMNERQKLDKNDKGCMRRNGNDAESKGEQRYQNILQDGGEKIEKEVRWKNKERMDEREAGKTRKIAHSKE